MQRISIARALIRNPDVILLDEATAALDPVNERAVQDTLDRVMKGFTTIAIAHRLTTIKDADKLVYFENGKLAEEGTHNELLNIPIVLEVVDGKKKVKSGFYHHQWKTQFNESGLNTHQLEERIVQMRMQIHEHESKLRATRTNVQKWRAAGRVLASYALAHKSADGAETTGETEGAEAEAEAEAAEQEKLEKERSEAEIAPTLIEGSEH